MPTIIHDQNGVLDQLITDSGKGKEGIDGEGERKRERISDRGS